MGYKEDKQFEDSVYKFASEQACKEKRWLYAIIIISLMINIGLVRELVKPYDVEFSVSADTLETTNINQNHHVK